MAPNPSSDEMLRKHGVTYMSKTWKQERPCWEDWYQWKWNQNERRETKVKMTTFLIYISSMFYSLNIYLLTVCICVYVCMSMCTGVWMLSEARSIRSLWVWSFNLLWTAWHGFWQLNSVPLQGAPHTLSSWAISSQPLSLFFKHLYRNPRSCSCLTGWTFKCPTTQTANVCRLNSYVYLCFVSHLYLALWFIWSFRTRVALMLAVKLAKDIINKWLR